MKKLALYTLFGCLTLYFVLFLEIYVFKIPEAYYSLIQLPILSAFGFLVYNSFKRQTLRYSVLIGASIFGVYSLIGHLSEANFSLSLITGVILFSIIGGLLGGLGGFLNKIFLKR